MCRRGGEGGRSNPNHGVLLEVGAGVNILEEVIGHAVELGNIMPESVKLELLGDKGDLRKEEIFRREIGREGGGRGRCLPG